MTKQQKGYRDWLIRLKTERAFCEELFRDLTIRLLCFKYAYYIENSTLVKDITYDGMEKSWYLMGRGLGHVRKDEYSPCVDFDYEHPSAELGINLYHKLK